MRGEDRLQSDPKTPKRVGEYQLSTLLGTGGMGRVYLAFDSRGTPVAVKVIRSELSEEPRFRLRFAREVHAMRAVSGPCTADLLAADLDATPQWIAMEYVPGPTLQRTLESEGPLPADTVRLLAWALAEGLSDIHRAGVIHRDLKPGNIILGPDGPRLLDFGIARSVDAATVTELGERPGSLGWMAPEQLRDAEQGTFTDVHAWGAVVYAAATGESPFGAGPAEAVAWRIENVDPPPDELRRVVPDIADVVLQALRADPSERPTVAELIAATRTVTDRDATTVKGITDIGTALATFWVAPAVEHSFTHSARAGVSTGPSRIDLRRRRRWRMVAAVGASVAFLATVGGFMWERSDSSAEPPPPTASPSPTLGPADLIGRATIQCESWVWAIDPIACPFARNVASRYVEISLMPAYADSSEGPPILGQVYDPDSGASFDMYCQREVEAAYCRSGDGAAVKMLWPPPADAAEAAPTPTLTTPQ